MNIIESNELIAEFMGLLKQTDKSKRFLNQWFDPKGIINSQRNVYLLFHNSWDWLIPVARKCQESQIFGSQHLINDINSSLMRLEIDQTYIAIIQFIQWYNENKSK